MTFPWRCSSKTLEVSLILGEDFRQAGARSFAGLMTVQFLHQRQNQNPAGFCLASDVAVRHRVLLNGAGVAQW